MKHFKVSQIAFVLMAAFACYFFVTSDSMTVAKDDVFYTTIQLQKYAGAIVIGIVSGFISLVYNFFTRGAHVPELTLPDKIIAGIIGAIATVILF